MNKKIGCVIVTYFPDNGFKERLQDVLLQVDKVIIVDNGSDKLTINKISKLISFYKNVEIITNNSNLGIAKALNIGCQHLLENEYLFSLLLDQDSTITEGMVESLLKTMIKNDNTAIIGPKIFPKNINIIKNRIRYVIRKNSFFFKRLPATSNPLKVAFNITSGSLIRLGIWKKIGEFWEDLFIEGVDNEYGLRVNSYGYDVYIDNNSILLQEYGKQRVKRKFGKEFLPTFHEPLRHYYVSRNRILIWRKHGRIHKYYVTWDIFSFFNSLFQIIFFESNKKEKLIYIGKGFIDGFKNKKGKYRG